MSPWFDYPTQQWRERHAVVVGAGIAGCQIAWHLAKLGWRVTLLERENQISSQASGNLAGIISPLMSAKPNKTEAFYLHAFEYTLQHLKALKAAGLDVDWFDCGVLQLAHSERELQRWHTLYARQLPTDFIQHLDAEQATKMAGIPCHYPANYFPQAGYINPASWCRALINDSDCQLLTSTQ
ncbi:MAG: FAD-dependent oxidoreductase, partial [Leucothrix sp.]